MLYHINNSILYDFYWDAVNKSERLYNSFIKHMKN